MSVRVVARVRPLLKQELEKDVIVQAAPEGASENQSVIRLPNPKNEAELFSYYFSSVYDQNATQKHIFDKEVAPTVKHLFNGFDVTIFAYGVTGTGKTHTMRGGKSLADRGVIPRLLSGVYRKAKKIETDSDGATQVELTMSYYEIYNDRVFDLCQSPEKRTATGLPIRDNNGKTVVCGLTERPCSSLKEFEKLYDEANVNRSTSATKLNAHSSRSHAVLCVKLTQISETHTKISTASCIDLAGSEDNRRTENNKDRMVESASINKSLFVLAQCVEAIGKKQARIPYRESKMTRILSLGQNNGFTVMILNLAPMRSYHLDTISSLNLASRTKKIEVNEVENEPIYRGGGKATASLQGPNLNRQPLRPLTLVTHNAPQTTSKLTAGRPAKSFAVYSDKHSQVRGSSTLSNPIRKADALRKRPLDATNPSVPTQSAKKIMLRTPATSRFMSSGNLSRLDPTLSKATIEEMIERRVEAKLAEHSALHNTQPNINPNTQQIPPELQSRLDRLERKIEENNDDERAEGLHFLLMAKQHQIRGEDASALRMYRLAVPYFPGNERLPKKISRLEERLKEERAALRDGVVREEGVGGEDGDAQEQNSRSLAAPARKKKAMKPRRANEDHDDGDGSYIDPSTTAVHSDGNDSDASFKYRAKTKTAATAPKNKKKPPTTATFDIQSDRDRDEHHTPRTTRLLDIINSRDVAKIRNLKGVGLKKAEGIVACLVDLDPDTGEEHFVRGLDQLGALKGVGAKGVVNMREGLGVV